MVTRGTTISYRGLSNKVLVEWMEKLSKEKRMMCCSDERKAVEVN